MTALAQVRRLWDHAAWADATLLGALEAMDVVPTEVLREYAHIIGAEAVWIARLEGRPVTNAIWPELPLAAVAELARDTRARVAAYLAALTNDELPRTVAYTNSAGRAFETPAVDILLQMALHGQYHRGKVNLLLVQSGAEPAPVDFIAFVRGVPAATTSQAVRPGA